MLASWAIPKGLPQEPNENHFAAATEDHPLEYLDFHGEIPKGQYGAGTIEIWDRGTYDCLKWEPRKVEVALHGERVDARYALFAIEQASPPKDWMIHRMDPPRDAGARADARAPPADARARRPAARRRRAAGPMRSSGTACARSPTRTPGELRLESRNLNEITDSYPELAQLNRALELAQRDPRRRDRRLRRRGRPSFAALQQRMHVASRAQAKRRAADQPVTYMIFDLLWLDGHSLTDEPYERRASC